MDLTESIAPKSDQLNADDLMTGPRTFTIESVSPGNSDQPVNIHLVEIPGRAYRPSKSMRRVLVAVWGPDSTVYAGRRVTLYRNPDITFGRDKVGGIEISHLTHLDKARKIPLTASKGKRRMFPVEPLTVAAVNAEPTITPAQWADLETTAQAAGITDMQGFIAEAIGRQIGGPQEITLHEHTVIREKIGGLANG